MSKFFLASESRGSWSTIHVPTKFIMIYVMSWSRFFSWGREHKSLASLRSKCTVLGGGVTGVTEDFHPSHCRLFLVTPLIKHGSSGSLASSISVALSSVSSISSATELGDHCAGPVLVLVLLILSACWTRQKTHVFYLTMSTIMSTGLEWRE